MQTVFNSAELLSLLKKQTIQLLVSNLIFNKKAIYVWVYDAINSCKDFFIFQHCYKLVIYLFKVYLSLFKVIYLFKVVFRVQIWKKNFCQNSDTFGYSFIKNDIMFMYILCNYKKIIVLIVFNIKLSPCIFYRFRHAL